MYEKRVEGWLKHWDFLLLDLLVLELVYALSRFHVHTSQLEIVAETARNQFSMLLACDLIAVFLFEPYKNILRRGHLVELTETFRHALVVVVLDLLLLFLVRAVGTIPRRLLVNTGIFYFFADYVARMLWKAFLRRKLKRQVGTRSMVVLTTAAHAESVLRNMRARAFQDFFVSGMFLMDGDGAQEMVGDVPVLGTGEDILDYVCRQWVDEVFLCLPEDSADLQKFQAEFENMGITVHTCLGMPGKSGNRELSMGKLGNYAVATSAIRVIPAKAVISKRLLDIAGGIVGCLITLLFVIIIGPMIYVKSPGPIFFTQTRVGKNGKKFKIYKFRSMYMDAEERKKALMEQQKYKDGMMFKMSDDPRIIGSEKKDKNGRPKGIGNFIRRTSIDEFPQFWNVLKGDMSLVGTRPPTEDEWEKYDPHHRARMSVRPGITGLWQISGRSEITDFEQIVALDTEYIQNWTFALDLKILAKTVVVVLKHEGAE